MEFEEVNLRAFLSNNDTEEELRRLLAHISDTTKEISFRLREPLREELETVNIYNEKQKKLDVWADDRIISNLSKETRFGVKEIASEEGDKIIDLKTRSNRDGRYSVTLDPLDGSSNIDSNKSIGTIIGIHDGKILDCRPARGKMVAAAYILYGPATTMMISTGMERTDEFLLNNVGTWMLKTSKIKMNDMGEIMSLGGLEREWTVKHREYVDDLKLKGYKSRYSGALVADVNELLIKRGGIFSYPGSEKKPEGKLRLLFELQPMAFLMENAGGRATNGIENILDIIPSKQDQREPIYLGSKKEVELAKDYLSR